MTRPDYYGNPAGVTGDVELVRTIYAAFAARDVERVIELADPECEVRLDRTAQASGRTGPYRGHEGVRQYFADVASSWDEMTLQADDIRAVPGSVIVMGQVEARRNGETLRRRVMWTWRLRDGKALSIRVADLGESGD